MICIKFALHVVGPLPINFLSTVQFPPFFSSLLSFFLSFFLPFSFSLPLYLFPFYAFVFLSLYFSFFLSLPFFLSLCLSFSFYLFFYLVSPLSPFWHQDHDNIDARRCNAIAECIVGFLGLLVTQGTIVAIITHNPLTIAVIAIP